MIKNQIWSHQSCPPVIRWVQSSLNYCKLHVQLINSTLVGFGKTSKWTDSEKTYSNQHYNHHPGFKWSTVTAVPRAFSALHISIFWKTCFLESVFSQTSSTDVGMAMPVSWSTTLGWQCLVNHFAPNSNMDWYERERECIMMTVWTVV